jgi:hypothetical protein
MREALPTTVLGRTGLTVTRLGYGAMEIRGSRIWSGRPVTDDQAERILKPWWTRASPSSTPPLSSEVYAEAKRRLEAVGERPAAVA